MKTGITINVFSPTKKRIWNSHIHRYTLVSYKKIGKPRRLKSICAICGKDEHAKTKIRKP